MNGRTFFKNFSLRGCKASGGSRERTIIKMKKIISLLLCAVCLLGLAACGAKDTPVEITETEGSAEVGMANPFVDCESMEDAASLTAFDFLVPETLDGYPTRTIQVMNNSLIQVTYTSDDGDKIILRKAPGLDDISGDYNVYADEKIAVCRDDLDVILRGDEALFSVAVWNSGDFSYALLSDLPMDENAMIGLIADLDLAD